MLVSQRRQDTLFRLERLQLQALREMAFLVRPQTEGIQGLDVGVARHWLHTALSQRHDERLQFRFSHSSESLSCARCSAFHAVSYHSSGRRDVLQVATVGEKLLEE